MNVARTIESTIISGLKPVFEEQTPKLADVEVFDEELKAFSERLLDFAKKWEEPRLAGLAANQLASEDGERIMTNMCVVMDQSENWTVAVNPTVYKHTENKEISKEGCLTWPGKTIHAERYLSASIKYQDIEGNEVFKAVTDFEAAVWQHEINHLQGAKEIVVNPKTGRLFGPSMDNGGTIVVKNKIGRNDPCSCDSGKKYKKCCGR